MMIVNDNYRVVNKLEASLTDDARVVIYDRHMFTVKATKVDLFELFGADGLILLVSWTVSLL